MGPTGTPARSKRKIKGLKAGTYPGTWVDLAISKFLLSGTMFMSIYFLK
jgi:hypothetical protein